ncbi:MAG: peptide chain release factor 1 [Clostridia bacterium]
MIEKLEFLKKKFDDLTEKISDNEIIADQQLWQKYVKEHSALRDIIEKYNEYLSVQKDMTDAKLMLETETDKEMIAMLEDEHYSGKEKLEKIAEELKFLLLPKDENDDKNIIIEIRAGAGGEEACLFAAEIKRMYSLYAATQRWKIEELDGGYTEGGEIKENSFMIIGKGAFAKMKYEAGVHRVQRVPETENAGRVHTSTITVAVLPETTNVEVDINENDIQIDTYRASGAGGQHVNRTDSAVRMTHIPTGLVVQCQDERSQIKNKEKALHWLKNKLYDYYKTIADKEYADRRKGQVGSGDRSEKIRTYNYPQNRVTDHRVNFTMYSLDRFLNGEMEDMIEALQVAEKQARLAQTE